MSRQVVFLHGGVINRHMWDLVLPHLSPAIDPLAIDLPGHGSRRDEEFTVDSSVAVVDEVAEPGSVLVGLSLGGYVAQAHAVAFPTKTSGLVLSGATITYTGWDGLSTKLYGYAFPVLARPAIKAMSKKLREDFGDDLADAVLSSGLSARAGGQGLRRLPGIDYAALVAEYQGEVVVANGERDRPNIEGAARFADLNPAAQIQVIPDAGHACAMQQPVAFAGIVNDLVDSLR